MKIIYNYLKQNGHVSDEHRVRPRGKFKVPGFKKHLKKPLLQSEELEHHRIKDKIPSLLSSYLKVGAKVCGAPARDKSFKCIDFMTLMNVEDMAAAYKRKHNVE